MRSFTLTPKRPKSRLQFRHFQAIYRRNDKTTRTTNDTMSKKTIVLVANLSMSLLFCGKILSRETIKKQVSRSDARSSRSTTFRLQIFPSWRGFLFESEVDLGAVPRPNHVIGLIGGLLPVFLVSLGGGVPSTLLHFFDKVVGDVL